jgi:small subunit ribosomal protein S2
MSKNDFDINLKEMAERGLHFGHKPSKTHPKMKPFIHGTRNGINFIDLEKTKEGLEKALGIIESLISEDKTLLIVGTKIQSRILVEDFAQKHNLPFVSERWLGGTISNFEVMKKRIDYFNELTEKKEKGELAKYTKKERLGFDLELKRLEKKFKGIKNLTKIPDALFILDITKDKLATKEAKEKEITIIGVVDANADPSLIDYSIPANDDAVSAIKYILSKLSIAVERGEKLREIKKQKEEKEEEKEEKETEKKEEV